MPLISKIIQKQMYNIKTDKIKTVFNNIPPLLQIFNGCSKNIVKLYNKVQNAPTRRKFK